MRAAATAPGLGGRRGPVTVKRLLTGPEVMRPDELPGDAERRSPVSGKPPLPCVDLVELRGLEPLTLCMPCRCATSCATAPLLPRRSG
jgi:hypothetical protein